MVDSICPGLWSNLSYVWYIWPGLWNSLSISVYVGLVICELYLFYQRWTYEQKLQHESTMSGQAGELLHLLPALNCLWTHWRESHVRVYPRLWLAGESRSGLPAGMFGGRVKFRLTRRYVWPWSLLRSCREAGVESNSRPFRKPTSNVCVDSAFPRGYC